jgi:hypothetical protein
MNRNVRAALCFFAAVAAIVGAAVAATHRGPGAARPAAGMALLAVLVTAAVILVALGVNLLLTGRQATPGTAPPPTSYRHAWPVFFAVAVVLAGALVARALAVPASFGDVGYYRALAPIEARDFPQHHIGTDKCAECHDEEAKLHDKDAHAKVACETCHGPGDVHAEKSGDAPLRMPKTRDDCLVCHRLLDARPGAFPQVRWQDHYRFVGVKDESVQCIQCHSPHEPLYMDRDLRTARLHPLIHRCRDCHIGRTDETLIRPAQHPAIFECNYCHPAIVADAKTRAHKNVTCTTCHIFIRDSDFAGRIIRDADPRFCLLCHRQADFRSRTAAPGIDWPQHLTAVGKDEKSDARCIDCHQDRIHVTVKGAPHGR